MLSDDAQAVITHFRTAHVCVGCEHGDGTVGIVHSHRTKTHYLVGARLHSIILPVQSQRTVTAQRVQLLGAQHLVP
eukprot:scaffold422_cov399-Prasinococcus_capsulatus_cf.AAC.6